MPSWKKVILSGSDAALNSLNVSTSLTASGIIYPTTDGTSGQVVITDGNGNLSFSNIENTTISIKNMSGGTIAKGTPCYITGSGTSGNVAGVWPADASNPLRMPAGVIAGESLTAGAEGIGLINGFIGGVNTSAFAAGDSIYVAVGGGYTNVRPTGSSVLIQKLGNVEKSHASNGSGVINGPGYYNEVPNIQQGFTWVGNSNGVATPIATSSIQNVISSSFASTSSFLNSNTNAFIQNGNSFGTTALLGTNDNNSLALETNGTTRMFISSSGDVGVGTVTPGSKFHVFATNSGASSVYNGTLIVEQAAGARIQILSANTQTPSLSFGDPENGLVGRLEYSHVDNSMRMVANAGEKMRITSTGNVGIGTTDFSDVSFGSPALKVAGSRATLGLISAGTLSTVAMQSAGGPQIHLNHDSTGALEMYQYSVGAVTFKLADTGNVGIGTTTPAQRLHVSGSTIITGTAAIGTGSLGPNENSLTLGARDTGGEGGQLGFNASGGTYTSASFIDLYQNKLRILKGTNATSTGEVANWNMHNRQMQLLAYTSTTSFPGTAAGLLAFDSSGNIITTAAGGTGTVTQVDTAGNVNGITLTGGPITGTGTVTLGGTLSNIQSSQLATSSLMIGTTGIALGATGSSLAGLTSVTATSFTGSLFGTASYATTAGSVGSISANVTNNTNNYVLTATGGSSINGEANLTFTGTLLTVTGTDDTAGTGVLEIATSGGTNLKLGGDTTYSWIQSHSSKPLYINQLGNNVILNSGGGNVGIGTTSPTYKLEVNGTLGTPALWTTAGGVTQWGSMGTAYGILTWDTGYARMHATSGNRLDLGAGGGLHMTIATSGNVGIGTTTPTNAKLEVTQASTGEGLRVDGNGGGFALVVNGGTSYSTMMRLASIGDSYAGTTPPSNGLIVQGNVGIGTTSPGYRLHVRDSANVGTIAIGNETYPGLLYSNAGSGEFRIDNRSSAGSGYITFYPNGQAGTLGNERMRIATNGAIKFNTYGSGTFTGTATQKLAVDSSGNIIEIPIGGGAVDGSGTTNYITKWTDADTIGNSIMFDNGTNVGIGTTSPSYKLDVIGSSRFSTTSADSYPLTLQNGLLKANNNYLGFQLKSSDVDYLSGILLLNGGTNKVLQLYAYEEGYGFRNLALGGGGNVGIGTTSPGGKLEINTAAANGATALILRTNDSGANSTIRWQNNVGTNQAAIGSNYNVSDAGALEFLNGNSTSMIIRSSGNVGIGTTSPSEKLSISGNITVSGIYRVPNTSYFISGDNGYRFNNSTDAFNNFIIYDNGNTYTRGNVGIGTSTPTRNLEVTGDVGLRASALGSAATQILVTSADPASTTRTIQTRTPAEILSDIGAQAALTNPVTGTGANQRVALWSGTTTLTSDADLVFDGTNLGIGITSPTAPLTFANLTGNKIDFYYDTTSTGDRYGIQVQSSELRIHAGAGGVSTGGITFGKQSTSTFTEAMRITNAGNVGIGTTDPGSKLNVNTSDTSANVITVTNGTQALALGVNNSSGGSFLFENNNNALRFGTSGTERMRITAGGSLLLGDSVTPSEPAWYGTAVFGKNGTNKVISGYLTSTTNGAVIGGHNSALTAWARLNVAGTELSFNIQETPAMFVNSSSNVGIGTTSPTEKVDIRGGVLRLSNASNDSGILAFGNYLNGTGYYDNGIFRSTLNTIGTAGNTLHIGSYEALAFTTSAAALGSQSVRMYIDGTSGYIGIGETSPTARLDIKSPAGNGATNAPTFRAFGYSTNSYFQVNNNGNNSANISLTRSDSVQMFNVDGHSGAVSLRAPAGSGVATQIPIFAADPASSTQVLYTRTPAQLLSDIGAAATSHTHTLGYYSSAVTSNLNTLYSTGQFGFQNTTTGRPEDYGQGINIVSNATAHNETNNWISQLAFGTSGTTAYFRTKVNTGGWGSWYTLFHSGNLTNPVTGTGANGRVAFWTGTTSQSSNANFFWDNSNGRLGIGTSSPQRPLEVISDGNNFVSVGVNSLGVGQFAGIHFGYRESNNLYRKSAIVFERTDLTANNAQGKIHILNGPQGDANNATLADAKLTIAENGNVGIGVTSPGYKLDVNGDTNVNGTLTATVKSFIIDHPTKEGKKLQYGVLEGPEHSVYVRGKLTNNNTITLPDYWHALVYQDTVTVNLTPIGKRQDLWVETVTDTTITVGSDNEINCYYTVFAERKDIEKLVTEFDK